MLLINNLEHLVCKGTCLFRVRKKFVFKQKHWSFFFFIMELSDHLDGGWKPRRIITPHLPERTCSLQSTGSSLWDFIPREAGTGITDQKRVNGRGEGGRGTGSRLWPWNRWSPKRHIQGCTQVWCLRTPGTTHPRRTPLPRHQRTVLWHGTFRIKHYTFSYKSLEITTTNHF